MEFALKMALRAFNVQRGAFGGREVLGVLGLKGSYRGDTIGAMNACEESGVFTCEMFNWFGNGRSVLGFPVVCERLLRILGLTMGVGRRI